MCKFFTTDKENGGTGLGLSITKDLIRNQLHGDIVCISEGDGVQFTLFIPNIVLEEEVSDE